MPPKTAPKKPAAKADPKKTKAPKGKGEAEDKQALVAPENVDITIESPSESPPAEKVAPAEAEGADPKAPKAPKTLASGRFILSKQLGSGCFGEVWLGDDKKRSANVAVKLEVKADSTKQLANEYEILTTLKRPQQQQGFTEVFHFGREESHICLVMELLGKSLEDWLEVCGGKFNVKTTALIGEQIVRRIEYLHSKSIIHRDIKPENFMMGVGQRVHIVYLIDFGLSEFFYDEGQHAMAMKDSLTGTARYASINAHDKAQSRRDDLEATGHMLIFFIRGSLPWSGLPHTPGVDEFKQICDIKKTTLLNDLCKGMPPEFEDYLGYCRALAYKQRPDYTRLRLMLCRVLKSLGNVKEHQLQWLEDDKELKPETLAPLLPWPDIEQPDDSIPAGGLCGCCKRREPLTRSSKLIQYTRADDADSIGNKSQDTE